MPLGERILLLALSVLPWLAAWPVLIALTPGKSPQSRYDWYLVGGYLLIGLCGLTALVTEPMRLELSSAPGPVTVCLMYAYFGYIVATGILMAIVGAPIPSLWAHHATFALLPLVCVLGGYWVELYAWLLTSQFVGAVHALARLAKRDGTSDQVQAWRRLEWFFLLVVRGGLTSVLTLVFLYGELKRPTYPDAGWMLGLSGLTLAVVAFPVYWAAPALVRVLRRKWNR